MTSGRGSGTRLRGRAARNRCRRRTPTSARIPAASIAACSIRIGEGASGATPPGGGHRPVRPSLQPAPRSTWSSPRRMSAAQSGHRLSRPGPACRRLGRGARSRVSGTASAAPTSAGTSVDGTATTSGWAALAAVSVSGCSSPAGNARGRRGGAGRPLGKLEFPARAGSDRDRRTSARRPCRGRRSPPDLDPLGARAQFVVGDVPQRVARLDHVRRRIRAGRSRPGPRRRRAGRGPSRARRRRGW